MGKLRNRRLRFFSALVAFAFLCPLAYLGHAEDVIGGDAGRQNSDTPKFCKNSSSENVSDPDLRKCEELVREAVGPLRQKIADANGAFGRLAEMRLSSTRVNTSDCTQVVDAALGTNGSGVNTLGEATESLKKVQQFLGERREHFEAQVAKLVGSSEEYNKKFKGNAKEWTMWYFKSCQAEREENQCTGRPSTLCSELDKICESGENTKKLRQVVGNLADPSPVNWRRKQTNANAFIDRVATEQRKALNLINSYLNQVNRSIAGSARSQEQLQSLSAQANGTKISCDSVGSIVSDPNGAFRQPTPGEETDGFRAAGAEAPPPRPSRANDAVIAGGSSGLGGNAGATLGIDPQQGLLQPAAQYTDQNGFRYFVSHQVSANGSDIYNAVRESRDGTQFIVPISRDEYDSFNSRGSDLSALGGEVKAVFSESITPVKYNGPKMTPGDMTAVYEGGQTDLPIDGRAGVEQRQFTFDTRSALDPSVRLGASTDSTLQGKTLVAADGRSLSSDQVRQLLDQKVQANINAGVNPNKLLSGDQRQAIADYLVQEAASRGGSYEDQVQFISSKIARMQQESNFQPGLVNGIQASGLTQILPSTATSVINSPSGYAVREYMASRGMSTQACLMDAYCNTRLSVAVDDANQRSMASLGYTNANNPYLTTAAYVCGVGCGRGVLGATNSATTDIGVLSVLQSRTKYDVSGYVNNNAVLTAGNAAALGASPRVPASVFANTGSRNQDLRYTVMGNAFSQNR